MDTGRPPDYGPCAAVDVHYLSTGGARAAAVLAADAAFAHVLAERTAVVPRVPETPVSRPDAAPHEQGQAVTLAPSAPIAVRKVTATGTGTPRIVQVGPSADPAGLTARARPEARPEIRAANLRSKRQRT